MLVARDGSELPGNRTIKRLDHPENFATPREQQLSDAGRLIFTAQVQGEREISALLSAQLT
jgi:hypothetical protein